MNKILFSSVLTLCLAVSSFAAGPAVRKAPDLMLQAVNSKIPTLASYKGKVVALEFILTTCSHCQQSCITLNKLHREFGAQGFTPIAVAVNDNANLYIEDFVKKFGITFPVGWQRSETAISFLQHPAMERLMMPQIVFIDREGVIRSQFPGSDKFFEEAQEANMRDQIKTLLGSPAGAAKKAAPAAAKKK